MRRSGDGEDRRGGGLDGVRRGRRVRDFGVPNVPHDVIHKGGGRKDEEIGEESGCFDGFEEFEVPIVRQHPLPLLLGDEIVDDEEQIALRLS